MSGSLFSNPRSFGNSGSINSDGAWEEMLARIGSKLCRLGSVVDSGRIRRNPGRSKTDLRVSVVQEVERERARIARELHSGAGQPLSGIMLNLQVLREALGTIPPLACEALGRLDFLTDQALQQIRAVSHRLHPPAWLELTMATALQRLVENSGIGAKYAVGLKTSGLSTEPPHAVKVAVYRCLQECLSNIVRHSAATAIEITVEGNPESVSLAVKDNGHGFDANIASNGIGLAALKEYASSIGGRCMVFTGPSGTEILIAFTKGEDE